ncbi:MAG: MotA/TolQ/ExbB proton channel family protein [Planctomycetes bacterium]|nr:MotA/TolQ/ExbB proton channel family protein [Planctomycetota bacterium]
MARSARARGSSINWFTFLVGVPLGVGVLYLIDHGPWQNERVQRYVHHEAEQAVVIFFCCCIATLFGKLLSALRERYALGQSLLPSWDGKPISLSEVTQLQQAMSLASDSVRNTFIGRRIENVLGFVANRGSAADLDDQLRTLSDNDALVLDGSYAINRFLIWAMPILGFLGTVLGITEAITGISPEQLERGAEGVSSGLTKAFDATALALSLTLIAMFVNSLLEKFEQGLLEEVDDFVDSELAHRFARAPAEQGDSAAMQELLEKQAALWADSMEKAEKRWTQTAPQQEKMVAALQLAIENALTRFGQRIVETEKKLLERQQAVLEALAKLAATLKDTGRDHQLALARLIDAIGLAVEMISKSQANEAQLMRLQETLSQNLALLANSATFEQAVESLTAAIHLLTTRVNPAPASQPRLLPLDKNAA